MRDYDFAAAHDVVDAVTTSKMPAIVEAAQQLVHIYLQATEDDNWLGNQDLGVALDDVFKAMGVPLPAHCEMCDDYTDEGETSDGVYCSACKEENGVV